MSKSLTLLGTGLMLIATGHPWTAQHPSRANMQHPVEHAEIGKLEWYDAGAEFIILGLPSHMHARTHTDDRPLPVSRNYRIDARTHVEHVSPMAAGHAHGLRGQEGGLVLIKYTYDADRLYTPWVYYIGGGEMREADGTVDRVDSSKQEVVVRNTAGVHETITMDTHGLIDGPGGLKTLTALHAGQSVRVFYVKRGRKNVAYLVRSMTS